MLYAKYFVIFLQGHPFKTWTFFLSIFLVSNTHIFIHEKTCSGGGVKKLNHPLKMQVLFLRALQSNIYTLYIHKYLYVNEQAKIIKSRTKTFLQEMGRFICLLDKKKYPGFSLILDTYFYF